MKRKDMRALLRKVQGELSTIAHPKTAGLVTEIEAALAPATA